MSRKNIEISPQILTPGLGFSLMARGGEEKILL